MAIFKKKTLGSLTFVKPASMLAGDTFEGYFLGSREDQYGGLGHKLKLTAPASVSVDEETTELKAGDKLVINGCGTLDKLLEDTKPGTLVQVIYKGTEKITGGKWRGKAAHQFEVGESDQFEAVEAEEAAPAPKAGKLGKVTA